MLRDEPPNRPAPVTPSVQAVESRPSLHPRHRGRWEPCFEVSCARHRRALTFAYRGVLQPLQEESHGANESPELERRNSADPQAAVSSEMERGD